MRCRSRPATPIPAFAYEEQPTLFLEFHGTDETVALQSAAFAEVARRMRRRRISRGRRMPEERTKLWKARHNAYWAVAGALRRDGQRSRPMSVFRFRGLPDCVAETQADIEEHGLLATIVGHAGDGNFHVLLLFDDKTRRGIAVAEAFVGPAQRPRAWRWTAPAPANTASARARWHSSNRSSAARST